MAAIKMSVRSLIGGSLQQFARYCAVGMLNTLITLATIFVLMKIFGVNYVVANAVGYVLGFTNSFIMNKIWTFGSSGKVQREAPIFVLVFAVSYGAQLVFLLILKEGLAVSAELSQIVAMGFYTIVNFLGNKYITFKARS
jgi:putative flippase GtrA